MRTCAICGRAKGHVSAAFARAIEMLKKENPDLLKAPQSMFAAPGCMSKALKKSSERKRSKAA